MRCETEDGGKRGLVMVRMRVMYESSLATPRGKKRGESNPARPKEAPDTLRAIHTYRLSGSQSDLGVLGVPVISLLPITFAKGQVPQYTLVT